MRITTTVTINRPADDVWRVVGPGFAEAATWASSIDESIAVAPPQDAPLGAPCAGRVCHVSSRGADRLEERLEAYDDDARSLTYRVARGMERVASVAQSTWSVTPLGAGQSTLSITLALRPTRLGRALAPVLRRYLAATSRHNGDDLRVFVETGVPSARKQRQLAGGGRLDAVVAGNAAFSAASGVALAVLPGWWSEQYTGPPPAVILGLGLGLISYGATLATLAVRGVSRQTGRFLAAMDAGWVLGTVALLAGLGSRFTATGVVAAVAAAVIVGAFGWAQWRAAGRLDDVPDRPLVTAV